jgi:hypothetical protein
MITMEKLKEFEAYKGFYDGFLHREGADPYQY